MACGAGLRQAFQSLNRAYKRSDTPVCVASLYTIVVSIPQSGLQAFRPRGWPRRSRLGRGFQSLNRAYKRSDHRRSVVRHLVLRWFQSLNRAYKRSDGRPAHQRPEVNAVSIPQSGLQAFRRIDDLKARFESRSFNPSIGLTSVPTWSTIYSYNNYRTVSIPQSGLQAFRHE